MNIVFRDALIRGIRRDSRQAVGAQALLDCYGRRCMEHGLRDVLPFVDPDPTHTTFSYGTGDWPFPQAFYGKAVSLICEETKIWQWNGSAWVQPTLYDARDFGESSPTAIASNLLATGGGAWQFLDLYDAWMLFNGTHTVFKTGMDSRIFVARTDNNTEVTYPFNTSAPNNWASMVGKTMWTVSGTSFTHTAGGTDVECGAVLANTKLQTSMSATRRYKIVLAFTSSSSSVSVRIGTSSAGPTTTFAASGTQYVYTDDNAGALMSVSVTSTVKAGDTVTITSLSVKLEPAPVIQTGCAWREARAIFGGFSNGYNYADWYTVGATDTNIVTSSSNSLRSLFGTSPPGANWVWWSSLNAADLLWLYSMRLMKYRSLRSIEAAVSTGYADTVTTNNTSRRRWFLDDLVEQRTFGMRPMPWTGTVRRVQPFNGPIVVYGQGDGVMLRGGVSALVPVTAAGDATFGIQHLLNIGVAGRAAVGGDEHAQFFVDENKELWTIDETLKWEKLGYQELLTPLAADSIVVSFNPREREVHIAGEETVGAAKRSYLLTRNGLSEIGRSPTSIALSGASIVAPYYPLESGVDLSAHVETDVFGLPEGSELPELDYVRLSGPAQDWSLWTIRVYYTFGTGTLDLHPTTFHPNTMGVARVKVSGTAFRIKASHASQSCPLDNIEAGFGNGDNRMLAYLIA